MSGLLVSDWIKMRKTWIPFLVILGPLGVVGLNAVRYALSHGIVVPGDDKHNWALLIQNTDHLLMPTLVLGVALLVSMLSGLEHQGHALKQLLALPVSRTQVYVSKFVWIVFLLAVSTTLCAVGMLGIGFVFGFSTHVAWMAVLQECYYPYLASYGIVAIQLLISLLVTNQAFAITLGVLGMIFSGLFDAITPDSLAHIWHVAMFIPWAYPSLSAVTHGTVQYLDTRYLISGLVVGGVMVVLGSVLFAKKEVK
jgi:lantibiotic transport system permease protein